MFTSIILYFRKHNQSRISCLSKLDSSLTLISLASKAELTQLSTISFRLLTINYQLSQRYLKGILISSVEIDSVLSRVQAGYHVFWAEKVKAITYSIYISAIYLPTRFSLVLVSFEPSFRLTRISVKLSTKWSVFGHLNSEQRIPLRLDDFWHFCSEQVKERKWFLLIHF